MTEHVTIKYTWHCFESKEDGQLWIDNRNGIAFEVRYCPFCGRKSKKNKEIRELKFERY